MDNNALVTLTQVRARAISDAITQERYATAMQVLVDLDAADVAAVFNELRQEIREKLVERAIQSLDPEFLLDLDDGVREQLLSKITTVALAEALSHMDTKDAISIIEDMSTPQQKSLLSSLNPETRTLIEAGLKYPEDSVGRIADTRPLAVPSNWTVGKTRSVLISCDYNSPYIILLDKNSKPEALVHMARFASHSNKENMKLEEMELEELYKITYDTDKEDAAFIFRRYKLALAAIVDQGGRLLGTLTPQSILQVEHEEAEEDIMNLTGISDADNTSSWGAVAFGRVQWLATTVGLTFLSSALMNYFSDIWEIHRELAVIVPMIAAIGGAALTQTVGVTVRSLLNRQLSTGNIGRVVRKELLVCGTNGVCLGLLVFFRCFLLTLNPDSLPASLIAGSALFFVMLWSGLVGVVIPFLTYRLGLDPATTAGPMLPVTADIMASMSLFSMARYFLT